MAEYRHKPTIVEAFRLGEDTPPQWFINEDSKEGRHIYSDGDGGYIVYDVEQDDEMYASAGDYIILQDNRYSVMSRYAFEAAYEEAEGA